MEALDTQFPDDGLENRLKENELNDNVQGRNSGNDKGIVKDVDEQSDALEVDVDDPVNLAFWAEQFEISPDDLKKAILIAGKSIDAVTHYLQK